MFISFLSAERIETGVISQYRFFDQSGNVISDKTGLLPLKIGTPSGVVWIEEGGITIKGNSKIESTLDLTAWMNSLITSKTVTFEAWIKPHSKCSDDNGIVFSSMKADGSLNFALIKEKENYKWMIRTNAKNTKGISVFSFKLPSASKDRDRKKNDEHDEHDEDRDLATHLALTIDAQKKANLYLNGNLISSVNLSIDFSCWDRNIRFQLAPRFCSTDLWRGDFYLFSLSSSALTSVQVKNNFQAGIERLIQETPITALVRHSPQINGTVEGSVQLALPESVTLNGGANIEGDFPLSVISGQF